MMLFLRIPQQPNFNILGGHSHHQDTPKNQKARHVTFFFIRITFSSHVSCIIINSSYGFTYSTCKYVIQSFLSQTLILSPHKLVSLLGFSIVIYSNLCLPWDENVIKIIQNCCLFMAFLPRSLSDKLPQTRVVSLFFKSLLQSLFLKV